MALGAAAATATDDPGNTGVGRSHSANATIATGTAGGTNSLAPAGSGGTGGSVAGAAGAKGIFPGGGGGGGASGTGSGGPAEMESFMRIITYLRREGAGACR